MRDIWDYFFEKKNIFFYLGFGDRMWDLIVTVPNHYLLFFYIFKVFSCLPISGSAVHENRLWAIIYHK